MEMLLLLVGFLTGGSTVGLWIACYCLRLKDVIILQNKDISRLENDIKFLIELGSKVGKDN